MFPVGFVQWNTWIYYPHCVCLQFDSSHFYFFILLLLSDFVKAAAVWCVQLYWHLKWSIRERVAGNQRFSSYFLLPHTPNCDWAEQTSAWCLRKRCILIFDVFMWIYFKCRKSWHSFFFSLSLFFYRSSSLSPAHSRPRSDSSRLCTAPATSSVCCSSKQEEPSGENRQGEHLSTRRRRRRRRRPIWGVCQDREEQEWQEEARVEHTEVETRLTCSYTWRSLLDVVL